MFVVVFVLAMLVVFVVRVVCVVRVVIGIWVLLLFSFFFESQKMLATYVRTRVSKY